MKICPTCQQEKAETEFYKAKRSADGLKSQRKKCHTSGNIRTRDEDKKRAANREHMARARISNPEKFRARDRDASRKREWTPEREARYQLNLAVKRGDIKKPASCEECGLQKRLTGHHDDYSKPLQVRWLCYTCHGKEHRVVEFKRLP